MAWTCSGRTNEELIDNLWKNGLITSERVRDAMKRVRRPPLSFLFNISYFVPRLI